jgi:5'-3' exonuclease
MAKEEEINIKKECIVRGEKERWLRGRKEEKDISNIPIILREEEKYVNIEEKGWEKRYYRRILKKESEEEIKEICKEYFQGIEWVLKYYTGECINWKWKYSYSYGPLLCDLQKYISLHLLSFKTPEKLAVMCGEGHTHCTSTMLNGVKSIQSQHSIQSQQNNIPFEPITQLIYVLPPSQLKLLPLEIQQKIEQEYSHLYPIHYSFQWAFCRYFWEAHPILPEIPLSLLDQFNSLFTK